MNHGDREIDAFCDSQDPRFPSNMDHRKLAKLLEGKRAFAVLLRQSNRLSREDILDPKAGISAGDEQRSVSSRLSCPVAVQRCLLSDPSGTWERPQDHFGVPMPCKGADMFLEFPVAQYGVYPPPVEQLPVFFPVIQ